MQKQYFKDGGLWYCVAGNHTAMLGEAGACWYKWPALPAGAVPKSHMAFANFVRYMRGVDDHWAACAATVLWHVPNAQDEALDA